MCHLQHRSTGGANLGWEWIEPNEPASSSMVLPTKIWQRSLPVTAHTMHRAESHEPPPILVRYIQANYIFVIGHNLEWRRKKYLGSDHACNMQQLWPSKAEEVNSRRLSSIPHRRSVDLQPLEKRRILAEKLVQWRSSSLQQFTASNGHQLQSSRSGTRSKHFQHFVHKKLVPGCEKSSARLQPAQAGHARQNSQHNAVRVWAPPPRPLLLNRIGMKIRKANGRGRKPNTPAAQHKSQGLQSILWALF